MKQQALSLLFLTVHLCSSEKKYSTLGGDVTFSPGRDKIKNVVWKFVNDKVAEYDPTFDEEVQYYGVFRGRTTLSMTSGIITISELTQADQNGTYSVEVDNQLLGTTFSLELVPALEEVVIIKISSDGVTCELNCTAKPSSDKYPLKYQWIQDEGQVEETNILFVKKDDWFKSLTCNASNQGSRASNQVIANDLCKGPVDLGLALGLGFGIPALLAVVAGVLFKKGIFQFPKTTPDRTVRSESGKTENGAEESFKLNAESRGVESRN